MAQLDKQQRDASRLGALEWTALRRIVLIVSSLIALCVAGAYAYTEIRAQQLSAEAMRTKLQDYANLLAQSINALDYDAVEYSSRLLLNDPKIIAVAVVDQFSYPVFGDAESTLALADTSHDIRRLPLFLPESHEGNKTTQLGYALFAVEQQSYSALIGSALFRGLLAFLITLIALAYSLYAYIAHYVTHPAMNVVDAIIHTTETGTPIPAKVVQRSQIGQLAVYFNKMQEKLLIAQDEQRVLADELKSSLESLSKEQQLSRLQLNALNEVLRSSGQSLIYFDAARHVVFSNMYHASSTLLQQAMLLAATAPEQLVPFLQAQDLKTVTQPVEVANRISSVEILTNAGRTWLIEAIELEHGSIAVICTDISERREIENKVVQTQKMESLGVLASGVAHEFNNILAIVRCNLELMQTLLVATDKRHRYLNVAIQNIDRASHIAQSMLTFAKSKEVTQTVFSVRNSANALAPVIISSLPPTIKFDLEILTERHVLADKDLFETAILNLVQNARDAVADSGKIAISVRDVYEAIPVDASPGRACWVLVEITDSGPGIIPAIREKVFDPFYTTKQGIDGTGLGLSLVYSFAQECGGLVRYNPTPEGVTRFQLYLPAAEIPRHNTELQVQEEALLETVEAANDPVLIIEDEPSLLDIMQAGLSMYGFEIYTAQGVRETEAILSKYQGKQQFRLVLTDFNMPDGTGRDVVDLLERYGFDLPVILLSGDTHKTKPHHDKFSKVIQKPIIFQELAKIMKEVISNR